MKKLLVIVGVVGSLAACCCIGSAVVVFINYSSRNENFYLGGKCTVKWFDSNVWYVVTTEESAFVVPDGKSVEAAVGVKVIRLGRRFAVITCGSELNGMMTNDYLVDLHTATILETAPPNSLHARLQARGEGEVIVLEIGKIDRGWIGGTRWPAVPSQTNKEGIAPTQSR